MHGVANYRPLGTDIAAPPGRQRHLVHNSHFRTYNSLELIGRQISGNITMKRGSTSFVLSPRTLEYARDTHTTVSPQPLRFVVRSNRNRYTGYVLQPALMYNPGKEETPNKIVFAVAEFSRSNRDLEVLESTPYGKALTEEWRIGEPKIVAANVDGYQGNVERNKAFLDRLAKASAVLYEAAQAAVEEDWSEIWKQSFARDAAD